MDLYSRRRFKSKQLYDWHKDFFPISLQASKKLKTKQNVIRFNLLMDDSETNDFSNKIGFTINGALSVYIKIYVGFSEEEYKGEIFIRLIFITY